MKNLLRGSRCGCPDNSTNTMVAPLNRRGFLKPTLKRALTLLALILLSFGAKATDYVFTYNGGYLAAGDNNTVAYVTPFDPATCIWRCYDGNTETSLSTSTSCQLRLASNTSIYLTSTNSNGTAIYTTTTAPTNARWRTDNSEHLIFRQSQTNYYAYYRGNSWMVSSSTSDKKNDNNSYAIVNNRGNITTDYRGTLTAINYTDQSATGTLGTPTVSYSGLSGTTGIRLTHTNVTGNSIPAHKTFVVDVTTYYRYNNQYYSSTDDFSTTIDENAVSYSWSVTSGNATISDDGIVTPNSDNTTNITVRVTANHTNPTISQASDDFSINVSSTDAASTYTGGLNAVTPSNTTLIYTTSTGITLDSPTRKKNSTPAYQTYTANGNSFYRVNNNFQAVAPSANSTDVALTGYNWSLTAGASNAQLASTTGATNTLTYSTASQSDVTATVSVTANYAEGGNATKTANVTLRKIEKCTTPTITLGSNGKVSITAGPNETIYYKTDDSYNDNGTYAVYSNALDVTDHTRIWAYSSRIGYLNSDETNITVADPYNVVPSTYDGINLLVDGTYNLTYTLNGPTNGEVVYERVVYASADPATASIDQYGRITALKAGSTTVSLTGYKLDGTTLTPVEVSVTVRNPYNDPTSISVNPTNLNMNQGETWQIVAMAYGTEPIYQKFKYEVTGTSDIASVSESGLVKALAPGRTEVTVTAYNYGDVLSSLTQTINITVTRPTAIDGKTCVYALSDITNAGGSYILMDDITASNGLNITFTGTFDGNYHTISGLSSALFNSINGGTVKSVRLAEVDISGGTDVGAIANTATSGAKIYNCGVLSGSVSGSRYVGGLVGAVSGSSVVVNNYSYADVSGGQYAAGIVGYNADDVYNATPTSVFNDATQIRIQNVSSSLYLNNAGNNTTLIISDNNTNSNYQKWNLIASGGGYKIKNVGRGTNNPYLAQSDVNGWTATFNNTGDVYTLEPVGDGSFLIHGGNGYLGTDDDNNNTTVYTDKGMNNNRYKWKLYVDNTQITSLVAYDIYPHSVIANNMFYGDITGGTHVSPIYGGNDINSAIVSSNYNYYSLDDLKTAAITEYNSALAAEKRYLERFEFYRGILNSNRRLAAFYVTGQNLNHTDNIDVTKNPIGKWVLDKSIAPYPIIKPWDKYPSLINPEPETTITTLPADVDMRDDSPRYHGKTLGMLSVTINAGTHGSGSKTIQIPITDMNVDEWDYTYYKIQLPYYNDHWNDNYQDEWVVTGWDISNIIGGTAKGFNTNRDQDDGYNYADRSNTSKDTQRTLAQGGWFCVPEGVTAITITAHWGHAVYLADEYVDVKATLAASLISGIEPNTVAGTNLSYGTNYFHSWNEAASSNALSGTSVYDNAVVLVGNFNANTSAFGNKAYTLISADFDHDNEPDYVMYYRCPGGDRHNLPNIRFDFLQMPGMGMGKKPTDAVNMAAQEILKPTGHFEITETALLRFTEFEYNENNVNGAPLIFNAGIVEQIMSSQHNVNNSTGYILLGGHCWFKEFTPGVHSDANKATQYPNNATAHTPITILGGEYEKFYLSGVNEGQAFSADNRRNARIYTNGGYFHMFAGAGQEQIDGYVLEKFDHSIVDEFFGGGINDLKPITGDITVTINNSLVKFYCGGPKFGNMASGKKVTTEANGSTFGEYYGAGYGGTSLARNITRNATSVTNYNYNDYNRFNYNATYGINTSYECEFFDWAGATGTTHVGRFYNLYASFSLAKTKNVESTLKNCLIKTDFYGGGKLGNVDGNATSTLENCTVYGNAFGGGFSATIPTCDVANGFGGEPTYNRYTGVFTDAPAPATTPYWWHKGDGLSESNVYDDTHHWIWTEQDLTKLGMVSGNTSITIKGNSNIRNNVYGGGNGATVTGNTKVVIGE